MSNGYAYVCEHGWKANHPFVHELGPVTTTGQTLPTPVCHPVRQEA